MSAGELDSRITANGEPHYCRFHYATSQRRDVLCRDVAASEDGYMISCSYSA
jgi:hypothetical protein